MESRMQGDLHVRFGGRLWETYHRKVVRRPSPSLHLYNIRKDVTVRSVFAYYAHLVAKLAVCTGYKYVHVFSDLLLTGKR